MDSYFLRSIALLITVFSAFSATSCKRSSSRHDFHVSLERSLDKWVLLRDPNQRPATLSEKAILEDYDWDLDLLLEHTGVNETYDGWIDELRWEVGISLGVGFEVAQDFRYADALVDEVGAVTGDMLIIIDGKLLDILLEYSSFLALWERGETWRTPEQAVDEIVFLHNEVLGPTTEGILFSYWDLSSRRAERAEEHFLRFLGALMYHEFAHIYLWHVLDELRFHGGFSFPQHPEALDEEDADLVAGMLVAKADLDLFSAEEVLDIATFQYLQTFDRNLYYDEVLGAYQHRWFDDHHPPLSTRKAIVHEGYDRFVAANGL